MFSNKKPILGLHQTARGACTIWGVMHAPWVGCAQTQEGRLCALKAAVVQAFGGGSVMSVAPCDFQALRI